MENKKIHDNIYDVGLILVQQLSDLMQDDKFRSNVCTNKYNVMSSITSSRTKVLKDMQKDITRMIQEKNRKENEFYMKLNNGQVTVDDFEREVVPYITECEMKSKAVTRSQHELQKWKNIQTRIFAKDKNVTKQIVGGLTADILIRMSRAVIANEDTEKYQPELITIVKEIVNSPELDMTEVTHETIESAFKNVVTTSLKSKSNAIKSNTKLLDASLDKMVHDFKLTIEEPDTEDQSDFNHLYKGNKIRKVDEFIKKFKSWSDGKIKDSDIGQDELEVFNKMLIAGYEVYNDAISGIKASYYNGIDQLSEFDVDALEIMRTTHVYRTYNTHFLPFAEKLSMKDDSIKAYGVNKFALLLSYIFFTLFIAENVELMFVLSV